MPNAFAGEGVEAKDLAVAHGQDHAVVHRDIDQVCPFEVRRPRLLAGVAIKGNHGSFDANKDQIGDFHILLSLRSLMFLKRILSSSPE